MYGKYPRSLYIELSNPVQGKVDQFNYWYNDVHAPDILSLGVFDRVYRYEAMGKAKAQYLAVWESDYVDLKEVAGRLREFAEGLRGRGHLWPVSQMVWAEPFFAVGPARPYSHKPVTFISTAYSNCVDPKREDEFNQWYNDLHLNDFLGTGHYHTAYRYQRYDSPGSREEGKFLALYESDADPAEAADIFKDLMERYVPRWYDSRGGNLIEVKQQKGRPMPRDLVLEMLPAWYAEWRPVWSSVNR